MKKELVFLIILSIALNLSCSQVVEPTDSIDPHGIFFSENGDIYKMNYDGSQINQITFNEEADNNNPSVTNNGKYLIYETQTYLNIHPSGGVMYDYSEISILNLTNSKHKSITNENGWCSQPSLSLDNQFLVFYSYKYNTGGCFVLSDIEGNESKILTEYGNFRYPQITPNGNKIIYIADHDQKTNLFSMDLNGKNSEQLTDTEWNINPSFSPDGNKIIWESYWDINEMNLDGSNNVNLTNNKSIFARTPKYSHSGNQIVFP